MSSIARQTDPVLVINPGGPTNGCPPIIPGIHSEASTSVFSTGLGVTVIGQESTLACSSCSPAINMQGSSFVTIDGLGVHRAGVDIVMAKCGIGLTLSGDPFVNVLG